MKICRLFNCEKPQVKRRTLCRTHLHRWNKYKSFDLPPRFPEGIVSRCKVHGELKIEETILCKRNKPKKGYKKEFLRCDKCRIENPLKVYGMSTLKLNIMIEKQNNLCKICNLPETCIHPKSKTIRKLSIDHNHDTGKVRDLLCNRCNRLLGYAKDSIELLESMVIYLKSHA